MKSNTALLHVPEFHEVVIKGCDYLSMGCCGNELFTVVRDIEDESRHHIIVTDVGYVCSVDNSTGMIDEDPDVIQSYLIQTHGEEVQLYSFEDMSTAEKESLSPTCPHEQNPVLFQYEENYFIYDTELIIIYNDERKTFNEVPADKKFLMTVVQNLIDAALKD